jgi:hypothetical protein
MVNDINGVKLYLDGYLKQNLDITKERVHKDWDAVVIVTGEEGSGKTTLTAECCLYVDPTFNLDKIVFNAEQFEELVDKAEPYTAILWDEADDLGGHWANSMLMAIKKKFMRIRSKNLFIFLVTPSLFHLSIYFVMHRPLFLMEVYSDKLERGYFRFFAKQELKNLYIHGKKYWNMRAWKPNFIGRFTQWPKNFPVDNKEYKIKKELALKDIITGKDSFMKRAGEIKYKVYLNLQREYGTDDTLAAKILDIHRSTIYNWRNKHQLGGDVGGLEPVEGRNDTGYLPKVLEKESEEVLE